jgi:hypothetical protein
MGFHQTLIYLYQIEQITKFNTKSKIISNKISQMGIQISNKHPFRFCKNNNHYSITVNLTAAKKNPQFLFKFQIFPSFPTISQQPNTPQPKQKKKTHLKHNLTFIDIKYSHIQSLKNTLNTGMKNTKIN